MSSIVYDMDEMLSVALFWHPENKSLVIPNVSRIHAAELCLPVQFRVFGTGPE